MNKNYVNANLDASDNVFSGRPNEPSSEMQTSRRLKLE